MPKLDFIYNPITGDKATFNGVHCRCLADLFKEFILTQPDYIPYFVAKENRFTILINDKSIQSLEEHTLLNTEDTVTIIPNVEGIDPVTMAAIMTSIKAGLAATGTAIANATGISSMASGISAVAGGGATLSVGGTSVAGIASSAGLSSAVSFGLGGTFTFAGGLLKFAAVAGTLYSAASSFSKSGAGGNKQDDPGSNSPTYSWNVEPSADEGIPIPVIYGRNKVGGNRINMVSESVFKFHENWVQANESNTFAMVLPIPPAIPYFNAAVIGLYPPVRGFGCELDPQVWFYVVGHFRIISWGDFRILVEYLISNYDWPKTQTEYQSLANIFQDAGRNAFSRLRKDKTETGWLNKIQGIVNAWKTKRNIQATDIDGDEFFESEASFKESDFNLSSSFFTGVNNTQTRKSIIDTIISFLQRQGKRTLNLKVVIPWVNNIYGRVFDEYENTYDNYGIYAVGMINVLPTAAEPKWFASNFHCLILESWNFNKISGINLPFPRPDWTTDTVLHQLIALGHGEIQGIDKVFFNDSPIDHFKGSRWSYFPGTNEQTFFGNDDVMDSYQKTVVSHSVGYSLEEAGDYVDFDTNPLFPANNVVINCEFTAFRMSMKGKITDLEDNPIYFLIMIRRTDVSFPEFPATRNITQLIDHFTNNDFPILSVPYMIYGGQQESFKRPFSAFPFVDLILTRTDMFVELFPGGISVAINFITAGEGIVVQGSAFDLIKFHSPVERRKENLGQASYRTDTYEALRDYFNNYFIKNKQDLHIRVMRLTPPVDNKRYTDKMTVVQFDEVSYSSFSYPGIALLGVNARATGSLSGTPPKVTAIVKGKKIWVPKLVLRSNPDVEILYEYAWYDEDAYIGENTFGRYRSMAHKGDVCIYKKENGRHVWSLQYCNNPIWCLYDLLTNKDYGLGNFIERFDIDSDIEHWISEAQYCDTMVPDGNLRWAEASKTNVLYDNDSDLISIVGRYYDSETGNFIGGTDPERGQTPPTDSDFWQWKRSLDGHAVFSTNLEGTWTKAVLEDVIRYSVLGTQLKLKKAYGTGFWTNNTCSVDADLGKTPYQLGQKRHTLNIVLDDETSAIDRIKQLCDTFRCFPIWVNGFLHPIIDRPTIPVSVIGMGSIIEDSFSIAYSQLSQNPNILECQFSDEEIFYEKNTVQLIDPDIDVTYKTEVEKYPRKESINLFGITNVSQVYRELNYRLRAKQQITKVISFTTGIENSGLLAGDVFILDHDILKDSGYSGRILSVDTENDIITIDQDIELEVSSVIHIKHTINSDEDAVEYVQDYPITKVEGNQVYAELGELKPNPFDNYHITSVENTRNKYRAISVLPTQGDLVEISAIEYADTLYGEPRLCYGRTDEYTYYDTAIINSFDKEVRVLPTIFLPRPVSDFTLKVIPNQNKVIASWTEPQSNILNTAKFLYTGVVVKLYVEGAFEERVFDVQKGQSNLILNDIQKGTKYNIEITALYSTGAESLPIVESFTIAELEEYSEEEGEEVEITGVTDIRLMWKNIPIVRRKQTEFVGKTIWVTWNRAGFIGANIREILSNNYNGVQIDYYEILVTVVNKNNQNTEFTFIQDFKDNKIRLDYEDLGLDSVLKIRALKEIRVRVTTYASNGKTALCDKQAVFTPGRPWKADGIKAFSFLGGVQIIWNKNSEWGNVEQFTVSVSVEDLENPGVELWNSGQRITSNTNLYVPIPYEVRKEISSNISRLFGTQKSLNPLGLLFNARYKIKVEPMTEWGGLSTVSSYSAPDEDDYDYVYDVTDDGNEETIDPTLIGPELTGLSIYARTSLLINTIYLENLKKGTQAATKTQLRYLIDNKTNTSHTFTGIGTNEVLRILVQSPIEYEYKHLLLGLNTPCYVWVQVPKREADGLFAVNQYDNYGEGSGDYFSLLSEAPKVSNAITFSSGLNKKTFPEVIGSLYMVIVIKPVSGTSVTIDTARFARLISVDEIEATYLSTLTANMGTLTAGKIYFNTDDSGGTLETPTVLNPAIGGGLAISNKGIFGVNSDNTTSFVLRTDGNHSALFLGPSSDNHESQYDAIKDLTDAHSVLLETVEGLESIIRITGDGTGISFGPEEGTDVIKMGANVSGGYGIDILSQGSINIYTGGQLNIESEGNLNIKSGGLLSVIGGSVYIGSTDVEGQLIIGSKGNIHINAGGDLFLAEGATHNITAEISGSFNLQAGEFINLSAGASINLLPGTNPEFGSAQLLIGNAFVFDAHELTFTIGNNIYFNGQKSEMQIGEDENGIYINGSSGIISSNTFSSGFFGTGFRLEKSGYAEFSDLLIRGKIQSAVIEYNAITSIGGQLLVTKTDVLHFNLDDSGTDMHFAPDIFLIDSFLYIKQGDVDEVLKISGLRSEFYCNAIKTTYSGSNLNLTSLDETNYIFENSSLKFPVTANSRIEISRTDTKFDFTGSFTILTSIYLQSAVTSNEFILSRQLTETIFSSYMNLYLNSTNGICFDRVDQRPASALVVNLTQGAVLETGKWYDIAITFDTEKYRLFVDGVLVDSATESEFGTIGGLARNLHIGMKNTAESTFSLGYKNNLGYLVIIDGEARYTSNYTVTHHFENVTDDTLVAMYFNNNMYSLTRGINGNVPSGHIWAKGTAVVSLGAEVGDGWIHIDSQTEHSPFIDVCARTDTSTWDAFGGRDGTANAFVRIGRLDGITDSAFGELEDFGLYSRNVYLRGKIYIDSLEGIKISGGGSLTVLDSGGISVEGGTVSVTGGGDINIANGSINVMCIGGINVTDSSGILVSGTGGIKVSSLTGIVIDSGGGLRVDNGGSITLVSGGTLTINGTSASGVVLNSGAGITINSGGEINFLSGGELNIYYSSSGIGLRLTSGGMTVYSGGNITVYQGTLRSSSSTTYTSQTGFYLGYSSTYGHQFRIGRAVSSTIQSYQRTYPFMRFTGGSSGELQVGNMRVYGEFILDTDNYKGIKWEGSATAEINTKYITYVGTLLNLTGSLGVNIQCPYIKLETTSTYDLVIYSKNRLSMFANYCQFDLANYLQITSTRNVGSTITNVISLTTYKETSKACILLDGRGLRLGDSGSYIKFFNNSSLTGYKPRSKYTVGSKGVSINTGVVLDNLLDALVGYGLIARNDSSYTNSGGAEL